MRVKKKKSEKKSKEIESRFSKPGGLLIWDVVIVEVAKNMFRFLVVRPMD